MQQGITTTTTKNYTAPALLVLAAFLILSALPFVSMPQNGWALRVGEYQVTIGGKQGAEAVAAATTELPAALARLDQTRVAWAPDFLHLLGNDAPSLEIIVMVVAWQTAENTGAAFNPLATTEVMYPQPDEPCWNSLPTMKCGVKNFISREQGLAANAKTIQNGYYPNILAGLQTNDPERVLNDGELATWGTGRGAVEDQYRKLLALALMPPQKKCPVTQPTMQINAHFTDTSSPYWAGQVGGMHNGVDIGGDPGTPVYAPFDLTVEAIQYYGDSGRIGWYVQGRFADGYLFYAGHLGTTAVQVGQSVPACTQIGTIGEVFHVHVKIAPQNAPVPCEVYARSDGLPWCEDFLNYYDKH